MTDDVTTRDKLLDAAARLFAERGIDNVSIAEIVRTAGQRNASALHYHFGTRNELLRELLAQHVPAIHDRRVELLERARRRPDDVRSAVEPLVRPVTELAQRGWRERAYLQIGSELAHWLARADSPEIAELMQQTAGFETWALVRERCESTVPLSNRVPEELWQERQEICISFIGRAAADRARLLDQEEPRLSDEQFVANLVAMVIGALTAPIG
jgi:AcrR family transcriptional regulator